MHLYFFFLDHKSADVYVWANMFQGQKR